MLSVPFLLSSSGIPYAPHKDPWVVLKRDYLDSAALAATRGNGSTNSSVRRVNGQEWYDQSAMRAVNQVIEMLCVPLSYNLTLSQLLCLFWMAQALGRVIRHKNDWGAVFLLDPRFQASLKVAQLSKWVRPRVQTFNNAMQSVQLFRRFLTDAMQDPELNPTAKAFKCEKY
jgi:hypothetical protein